MLDDSDLMAGVDREFIGVASPTAPRVGAGGYPCQGLYTTPKGRRPATAFIATHYNVDFAEHYIAPYLAARGFGFLGWNTRYRGDLPSLVVQGMADTGVFPSDARKIFGAIGSADKTLELITGAHYFEDSRAEREAMADLLAAWVEAKR